MSADLKNLAKIIALCRKTGVTDLEIDGVKLSLAPTAPTKRTRAKNDEPQTESSFSDEDALFWSAPSIGIN